MHYADHDRSLLVWGVATESATGELTVCAHRSADTAADAADHAPRLTINGPHPVTGKLATISDVSPLVYHHAEDGWTLASIGWALTDCSRP